MGSISIANVAFAAAKLEKRDFGSQQGPSLWCRHAEPRYGPRGAYPDGLSKPPNSLERGPWLQTTVSSAEVLFPLHPSVAAVCSALQEPLVEVF